MKTTFCVLLCLIVLVSGPAWANVEVVEAEAASNTASNTASNAGGEKSLETAEFIVSYLHMNRRCATCKKLEEYATEAVSTGFAEQLGNGSLVWRTANFEEDSNKHLATKYGLYTQALVVSQIQDGKEVRWENLKAIWPLVNDKEGFVSYVQRQIKSFMEPTEKASQKSDK
ncbi:MAG: hypothetical protein GY780_04080 [bacterium]|nr:hypothetical protein [bacterium]